MATLPPRAYTAPVLISPARRIAFDVLRRVAEGAYASELLYRRLDPRLSRADAALATQITLGVLRWQRLLDFLIAQNLDRPIASLDLEVLLAMRIGLYQLRYLERIPAHAAVGESVELAKHARKRSASSLINAVLRRAAINAKASPADLDKVLAPSASAAERAGVLYSHPTWLIERWFAAHGTSRTMALLDANNRPPRVSCVVLPPQELDAVAQQLRTAGLTVRPGRWLNTALSISDGKPTDTLPFREGRISLQDEASQMIGHILGAASGETVLDLCAAPGGKQRSSRERSGHRARSLPETYTPIGYARWASNWFGQTRGMRRSLSSMPRGRFHSPEGSTGFSSTHPVRAPALCLAIRRSAGASRLAISSGRKNNKWPCCATPWKYSLPAGGLCIQHARSSTRKMKM